MSLKEKMPKVPKWARGKSLRRIYHILDNPPASYRQMWRRLARAKIKNALQRSRDIEELSLEHRANRITSKSDWY